MTYPYQCPKCNTYNEVIKPHEECSTIETCKCGEVMERIYSVPNTIIKQYNEFNHGLGIQVNSKKDVTEHLAKLRGKGVNLVEVGNEKMLDLKPKSGYNLNTSEKREIVKAVRDNIE